MKFIAFFEWDPKDREKARKKLSKLLEERKKYPDKYPKDLSKAQYLGTLSKGFNIYEAKNEEQLINFTLHYSPELKVKWVPLLESTKVTEIWDKMKE